MLVILSFVLLGEEVSHALECPANGSATAFWEQRARFPVSDFQSSGVYGKKCCQEGSESVRGNDLLLQSC